MICPHCFKTVDDTDTFCPSCHAYLGGEEYGSGEFVFCEGCGARLSAHNRTCPKCGRPAPGILSTESASSDLAAGRTASFPRLSKENAALNVPEAPGASGGAGRVLSEAADPFATSVIDRDELNVALGDPVSFSSEEDPYHKPPRRWGKVVATLVLIGIIAGAGTFLYFDPYGLMPQMYASVRSAASKAFPSRQAASGSNEDSGSDVQSSQQGIATTDTTSKPEGPMSDGAAFTALDDAYTQLGTYDDEQSFGEVVDAFNSYYLAADLQQRKDASASAYSLRDAVQKTIDILNGIQLEQNSALTTQLEHVKQLAQWMYGRVDQICAAWDVSLAIPQGESTLARKDDILAPMREAGTSDLENFNAHYDEWKPTMP